MSACLYVVLIFATFFQHVVEQDANTRLPQYLGMYRITINDSDTYFIVMRNIFSPRIPIHRKYDLKVHLIVSSLYYACICVNIIAFYIGLIQML